VVTRWSAAVASLVGLASAFGLTAGIGFEPALARHGQDFQVPQNDPATSAIGVSVGYRLVNRETEHAPYTTGTGAAVGSRAPQVTITDATVGNGAAPASSTSSPVGSADVSPSGLLGTTIPQPRPPGPTNLRFTRRPPHLSWEGPASIESTQVEFEVCRGDVCRRVQDGTNSFAIPKDWLRDLNEGGLSVSVQAIAKSERSEKATLWAISPPGLPIWKEPWAVAAAAAIAGATLVFVGMRLLPVDRDRGEFEVEIRNKLAASNSEIRKLTAQKEVLAKQAGALEDKAARWDLLNTVDLGQSEALDTLRSDLRASEYRPFIEVLDHLGNNPWQSDQNVPIPAGIETQLMGRLLSAMKRTYEGRISSAQEFSDRTQRRIADLSSLGVDTAPYQRLLDVADPDPRLAEVIAESLDSIHAATTAIQPNPAVLAEIEAVKARVMQEIKDYRVQKVPFDICEECRRILGQTVTSAAVMRDREQTVRQLLRTISSLYLRNSG